MITIRRTKNPKCFLLLEIRNIQLFAYTNITDILYAKIPRLLQISMSLIYITNSASFFVLLWSVFWMSFLLLR